MLQEQRRGGLSGEGRTASEALVKGGRGRVDITSRAGGGARHLLGRRVRQGARRDRAVTGARRDAEVGQLTGTAPVHQHVLWLVVPVHDTMPVRGRQA